MIRKRTPTEQNVYDLVAAICRKRPGVWWKPGDHFALGQRGRLMFAKLLNRGDFENDAWETDEKTGAIRYRKPAADLRGQMTLEEVLR